MNNQLRQLWQSSGICLHGVLLNSIIKTTESSAIFNILRHCSNSSSSYNDTFKYSDLQIERCSEHQHKPKPDWSTLKFGKEFSDHMFMVEWNINTGWGRPRIVPFQHLVVHPASKVFHYATELYEGMKAYRGVDNKIRLFRPEMNVSRMLETSRRAQLPSFHANEFLSCLAELVRIEKSWVPDLQDSALYIRPTSIATDPTLVITNSHDAMIFVILCPVAAYYPTGFAPVTLLADPQHVRANKGGVGRYKMGSNYAATIKIAKDAKDEGFDQVLWLGGDEELITEVGTMNMIIVWRNEQNEYEIVSPGLDSGLILPGITRASCLELLREWNVMKVSERDVTIHEVIKANKEGRLLEIFGTGTACVVSAVAKIVYRNGDWTETINVPDMEQDSIMRKLYDALTDIQYGRVSRPEWVQIIEE